LTSLTRLALTDFRNYASLTFHPGGRLDVLTGPNGSGKTNLLEAISVLLPGRGLRAARPEQLPRHGSDGWAVASRLQAAGVEHELGTGTIGRPPGEETRARQFRLDGAPVRSQADLLERVAIAWLTPQMERLFGEAASGRRRFLDRLVAALQPGHTRALSAHDASVAGRNRLLLERRAETAWLNAAEDAIARHATAITAARLAFCRRLDGSSAATDGFPAARLTLLCPIAERLATEPARLVEDELRTALAASRDTDARAGATSIGAHRCDLAIAERDTGLPAHLASTGQQKALLVGLVLAHAALIENDRGDPPILLLDEPLVHLDEARRACLFARLGALRSHVLATGTDPEPFAPLAREAVFWQVGGNAVQRCS
jgi:DNA replication and repair protein RecF